MSKNPFLILLFVAVFSFGKNQDTQIQINKSLTDTVRVELKGTNIASTDTRNLQNALSTPVSSGALKIIMKGNFQINNVIAISRDHTILSFEKNSKLLFINENSGLLINKNSCVIENGFFSGTGKSAKSYYEGYGILLQGASQCIIRNNRFDNISGINIMMMPNKNIGCQKNIVKNNVFTNPKIETSKNEGDDAVILIGYSGDGYFNSNNVIENNDIDGNNIPKIGIGIIGHGRDNLINNNKVRGLRHYGIIAYESVYTDKSLSGTVITNNTVENIGNWPGAKTYKGMGIYLLKSPNSKIIGNKVYNILKSSDQKETLGPGGISVSMSPHSIIENNIIDESYMYGITSDYSFDSKFINNTIQNTRKSGIYFMNMNDVDVSGNIFKNIGEVVIKGYFENTSLQYIKDQMQIDTYKNLDTGNNFVIKNNKIYSNKEILFFYGTEKDGVKRNVGNKIKNNIFENNDIIGNIKNQYELVNFRQESPGTNFIRNNRVLR